VNIDNPDWIPPSTRNDARYFEDEEGGKTVSGVRKSRFLKKSKQVELSYKDKSEDVPVIAKSGSQSKYESMDLGDDTQDNSFKSKLKTSKNSRGLTVVEFPHDPDDLPALPAAPPRNIPKYHGWTHSDNADSWFLEAHTPSIHDNYESFYDEALKKKVICPKFYSCV